MYTCEECEKGYNSLEDLHKHRCMKHGSKGKKDHHQKNEHYDVLHFPVNKEPFMFQSPTTILVSGPTMSGKSQWTFRLIQERERMFATPPTSVLYAYSIWQDDFDRLKDVTFHQGLPSREDLENDSLLILDDVMHEASTSEDVMKLFTIDCHHRNITVIFLTQVLFAPFKYSRTLSLNMHYIILFATKRDRLSVACLGRQMFPRQQGFFLSSYEDSISKPYGYLVCDLHPGTEKRFQLRTKIFPGEYPWVYQPL